VVTTAAKSSLLTNPATHELVAYGLHHCGAGPDEVQCLLARTGSLIATAEALAKSGHRLVPVAEAPLIVIGAFVAGGLVAGRPTRLHSFVDRRAWRASDHPPLLADIGIKFIDDQTGSGSIP
jgi:hypothetical protein